ncbi:MAG TPA: DUF6794 domain-containing protein [Saprospiraceae bacterium]|nr:DUF6794 domain-containing protein [Saprospiraceae bacterium]
MNRILCGMAAVLLNGIAWAQNTEAEFLKNYESRIGLEYINEVYIPKDLADAMRELDRLTNDAMAAELLEINEDSVASKLHFSLGRWMAIHWGLEEGSRLSHHLKSRGLSFPDDMMDLLIRCWYRHLKGQALHDQKLINSYIVKRKREHEERLKKRKGTLTPLPKK